MKRLAASVRRESPAELVDACARLEDIMRSAMVLGQAVDVQNVVAKVRDHLLGR